MNELVKRYPVGVALAGVAALLAVIVVLEAATGSAAGNGAAKTPSANVLQAKLLPPLPPVPSETAYPEMSARPLFTPTRRPAPPSTTVANSSMSKGQFVLSGVTIAHGLRIALLREKSSGRVVRVEQGKDVNGMTVASIEPERVTLAAGGDQEVLSLQVQKGPGGVTPPAAPMPSGGPFGGGQPPPGSAAAANVPPPGQPQPAPPALTNPAARPAPTAPVGGFGPYVAPPDTPQSAQQANPNQSAPLTPEELLARRRARRTQPSR